MSALALRKLLPTEELPLLLLPTFQKHPEALWCSNPLQSGLHEYYLNIKPNNIEVSRKISMNIRNRSAVVGLSDG